MQRCSRRQRGMTLIEVMISSALAVVILGGAVMLMDSADKLASSSARTTAVSSKADRAVWLVSQDLRRATLASAAKADGTGFFDGDESDALTFSLVSGFDGATVIRGDTISYRFVRPAGAAEGEIFREQNGVSRLIARRVTDFNVSRNRAVFRVAVSAVAGPDDDRARRATAVATILPRNP
jgi:prepilin-type N-terminal cleavage/methylation domain-containing protein